MSSWSNYNFGDNFYFILFFWRLRVCWPLLCLCRPFCIFERCLDSNPERCHIKQASYQCTNLAIHLLATKIIVSLPTLWVHKKINSVHLFSWILLLYTKGTKHSLVIKCLAKYKNSNLPQDGMAKTLLPLLSLYGRLGRVVKERELSDWEKGSNYAGEGERGEAILITCMGHIS